CQLVEERVVDNEAIFIDGIKSDANVNKFTFVWKKAVKDYSKRLMEHYNKIDDELLEQESIAEIKRESPDELSLSELDVIDEKLDEKVNDYNNKIEECEIGSERKKIRSERKFPKQALKRIKDFIDRKK